MGLTDTSKFLSLVLRYKPDTIGISLDEHGWANVSELIESISKTRPFDMEMLEKIVQTDNKQRYSFNEETIDEILNQEQPENQNIYEIMQLIGKKRGAIISGGNIDDEKTSKIILDDFRSGKLGRVTIEKVKRVA